MVRSLRGAVLPQTQGQASLIHRTTLFHANLLQCLQDGCIGSDRFEVATSLLLLFVNRLEENETALDIDSE
jgi:hypothetical protein